MSYHVVPYRQTTLINQLRNYWYNLQAKYAKIMHDHFGGCWCCGSIVRVQEEDSRTMYHWDGKGKNPNAPVKLCRLHAKLHHEHWDAMWAEYNNSR